MSNVEVAAAPRSQYVDFWNTVLVPKFVRWRHILVGGLTLHSAASIQGCKLGIRGCFFVISAVYYTCGSPNGALWNFGRLLRSAAFASGTPAQSLRNFAAKQGWNSDSLLFQNAPSHFDSHGKVAEPGDSATWDDSNLWIA